MAIGDVTRDGEQLLGLAVGIDDGVHRNVHQRGAPLAVGQNPAKRATPPARAVAIAARTVSLRFSWPQRMPGLVPQRREVADVHDSHAACSSSKTTIEVEHLDAKSWLPSSSRVRNCSRPGRALRLESNSCERRAARFSIRFASRTEATCAPRRLNARVCASVSAAGMRSITPPRQSVRHRCRSVERPRKNGRRSRRRSEQAQRRASAAVSATISGFGPAERRGDRLSIVVRFCEDCVMSPVMKETAR